MRVLTEEPGPALPRSSPCGRPARAKRCGDKACAVLDSRGRPTGAACCRAFPCLTPLGLTCAEADEPGAEAPARP